MKLKILALDASSTCTGFSKFIYDESTKNYEYLGTSNIKATDKDIYKRFPEGESLSDLYNRILYYYHDILKEDNTLLVTHRGVINMIYYILTNTKLGYNKKGFNVTHSSIHEYDPTLKKIKRIY